MLYIEVQVFWWFGRGMQFHCLVHNSIYFYLYLHICIHYILYIYILSVDCIYSTPKWCFKAACEWTVCFFFVRGPILVGPATMLDMLDIWLKKCSSYPRNLYITSSSAKPEAPKLLSLGHIDHTLPETWHRGIPDA